MNVHFYNIVVGKAACFTAQEPRALAFTVIPADVTCSECLEYLRGSHSEGLRSQGAAPRPGTKSGG